jgi:hypothetical protein
MSLLAENLRAARKRFPEVEGFLASAMPGASATEAPGLPGIERAVARTGLPTGRMGGSWLHSRYDPENEAKLAAEEALALGAELVLLAGLGYAYGAEALLASGAAVLALEPNPACLLACMETRELSALFSHERFFLIMGMDSQAASAMIERLDPRSLACLITPAYKEPYSEELRSLRQAVDRFQEKDRINEATLKRFGRRWVKNLAHNAERLLQYPGITRLRGLALGLPATVLAAGPSLDELLPLLKDVRERSLIVCVDTALRSALRAGVQPDFVVVVDPQYWNARHLDRCVSPSSILISEAAVWPSVFRFPFRAHYLCSSLYPLGRYIEERAGAAKGSLGAGGSVSTSAWDFARLLGCAPIYLAGLDLGFPGGKTHADASLFEQRSLADGTRLAPSSHASFGAMRGGQPFLSVANDGSPLVSDRRLSLYAWWFSAKAAQYPEAPSYTLSRSGLAIPGIALRGIDDILALAPVRADIDERVAGELKAGAEPRSPPGRPQLSMAALKAELGLELKRIEESAERGLTLVERARQASGDTLNAILEELGALDAYLLGSSAKDVVGFLFSSLEELLGGRVRDFSDSLDKSARLYREIAQSARWHGQLLGSA